MRARVVAPLVAAILGIAGGAVTAIVMEAAPEKNPDDSAFEDPLGLGMPLINLDCAPGRSILILGTGDASGSLFAAAAENPSGDPRYLATADSCDTVYGPERLDPDDYVVYLGPYDGPIEPCTLRMDPVRRGDFVTNLQAGNEDSVKCVCVLPPELKPDLRVGMEETAEDAVWVRSLQGMFADDDPERFSRKWITGVYDQRTADRVIDFQAASSQQFDLGVVDRATWGLLGTRLCSNYVF